MDKIEDPNVDEKRFHARFTPRVRGGKRVLEVKDLTIGYDLPLCTITCDILQGEKVAIIGPNGKGKSTFLKTLMEQVSPLSGEFLFEMCIRDSP